jgi:hypothetical protein
VIDVSYELNIDKAMSEILIALHSNISQQRRPQRSEYRIDQVLL